MNPLAVERPLFILAPILALGCALISVAVAPRSGHPGRWRDLFQIANVNIGLSHSGHYRRSASTGYREASGGC